ncbi:MAG: hypothetical protein MK180_13705 [Rhodobacteraceae bacterium]|nr:hypothetical protein [Paracoccaceae bacterium]
MVIFRLFIIMMVISTVLYIVLSFTGRRNQRAKLEEKWRADLMVGDREQWLRLELAKYDHSLKRRLTLLVFVLPLAFLVFIGIMLYVQNFM